MRRATRCLCVALLLLALSACNDQKKLDDVAKYCVLTTMPHRTVPELLAIQAKAIALFKERKPYKATDANRAVTLAATNVSETAGQYVTQIKNPQLLKAYPKGMGFPQALEQLKKACAALPKAGS